MKLGDIKKMPAEKISQRVLYWLIGVIVVLFALFYLVGYDLPFLDNPDFNAPLFTDVLIYFMVLLFIGAISSLGYSAWKGYRSSGRQMKLENGIPETKLRYATWAGTAIAMLLSFLIGSSSKMIINGRDYSEWGWLKLSDMFIWTSIVLLCAAIVAVIFGATRYRRRK